MVLMIDGPATIKVNERISAVPAARIVVRLTA